MPREVYEDAAEMGERFRERRESLGWTQEEAAREVGVLRGLLARIEQGAGCRLATFALLCEAYDYDPAEALAWAPSDAASDRDYMRGWRAAYRAMKQAVGGR